VQPAVGPAVPRQRSAAAPAHCSARRQRREGGGEGGARRRPCAPRAAHGRRPYSLLVEGRETRMEGLGWRYDDGREEWPLSWVHGRRREKPWKWVAPGLACSFRIRMPSLLDVLQYASATHFMDARLFAGTAGHSLTARQLSLPSIKDYWL
jgi:hypothetical protein